MGSGTNLTGLVQHLTFAESRWFEQMGGQKTVRGHRSMRVEPSVSLQTLRSEYRAACTASNEIIVAVGDGDAPVINNGKSRNLRWVLLAAIEETARHAGHADIIREQIDGRTGVKQSHHVQLTTKEAVTVGSSPDSRLPTLPPRRHPASGVSLGFDQPILAFRR